MRRWIIVVSLGLVAGACAGGTDGAPPSSIGVDRSVTTGPTVEPAPGVEPSTTVPTEAEPTSEAPDWPSVEILVTNEDGMFQIDADGEITQLAKGRVAYAVDDTRGGLLFQVERGRSLSALSDPNAGRDTIVWWVPEGEIRARDLLVPTPGSYHSMSLHDAVVIDGRLQVLYVREDSTFRPEYPQHGWLDSLRAFDVERGDVVDLWVQPVWESGIDLVNGGGDLVAATSMHEGGAWCSFLDPGDAQDPGYDPMAWDEIRVGIQGVPTTFDDWWNLGCALSPDGSMVGYIDPQTVNVVTVGEPDLDGAQQFEFGRSVVSLDLTDSFLLANHPHDGSDMAGAATVIDLATAGRWNLPIDGVARFASAPVAIDSPVVPPTPAAVQLRVDGLGVVDFEMTSEEVSEALVPVMGSAPIDGWSSAAWVEHVGWHDFGLYLGFSTSLWTAWDGTSRLVGWEYSLGRAHDPVDLPVRFRTLAGVTIGSTVADLRRIYGESLRLPVEEEVCVGWVVYLPNGVMATLDGPPEDDAGVVSLFFGVGVGC